MAKTKTTFRFFPLLVAIILALIAVGIGLGYYFGYDIGFEKSHQAINKSSWTAHIDIEHNVIFNFPTTWGSPKSSYFDANSNGSGIGHTIIDFSENKWDSNNPTSTVHLTKYSDYIDQDGVNRIKQIYSNKKIDNNDPIWLPPSNAGISHFGDLHYVENKDSSIRGAYYFARIAQNGDEPFLNSLIVTLTDGKENIISLQMRSYDRNANVDYTCNNYKQEINCKINKDIFNSEALYKEIVASMSLSK